VSAPELDAPLLKGRYRPIQLLSRGGSSLVFRGRDELLGKDVAIKLFTGADAQRVAEFRSEVRVVGSLGHHGIVAITDAGIDRSSVDDPRPFLVMEFVPGETLRETISRKQLSIVEVGEIGFELAEVLEYVHSHGVVHRDIAPSNVMLVHYNTASSRTRARLTDFGIAAASGSERAADEPVIGTAAYLSPEQASGATITTASDIYSLGLVLLEALTDTRAFAGEAVESAMARLSADPEIPDSLPEAWRELLSAMVARDPALRPSAEEIARDIRALLRRAG
jgi:serine/threonine protein kinase